MAEQQVMAGWDAITAALEKLYPNQQDPKHYAPTVPWELGGEFPLSGVSAYDAGDYYHLVSYGLSELVGKENNNPNISGFGMEFTWKLAKNNNFPIEDELTNLCSIMQALARITFTKGNIFKANEFIHSGENKGIDANSKSKLTGIITILDPELKRINTPNGKVDFIEIIGVTTDEVLAVKNKQLTVPELYAKLGSDITDYSRDSVL